jgi:hypothetical protein
VNAEWSEDEFVPRAAHVSDTGLIHPASALHARRMGLRMVGCQIYLVCQRDEVLGCQVWLRAAGRRIVEMSGLTGGGSALGCWDAKSSWWR